MTFENQDIQLQTFFPNLETPLGETFVATVNEDVEFSLTSSEINPEDNGFDPGYNIDITENSIIFETVEAPLDSPLYNSADIIVQISTALFSPMYLIQSQQLKESLLIKQQRL